MTRIPAYALLYDTIKREIMEEQLPIGSLLPSEPELEKRFGVSRTTVRRAVGLLSNDGFVLAERGKGTRVLDYKTRQSLNMITSFSETLSKRGYDVTPKNMHIDVIQAPKHIAKSLEIPAGTDVARIQRIQLADGKPIAIIKNYIPALIVPGIENEKEAIQALYKYLENSYNVTIDSAHDSIVAINANYSEAQMLDIPVGNALLKINRVGFFQSKPVCVDQLKVVGDRYELEVNMTGRDK